MAELDRMFMRLSLVLGVLAALVLARCAFAQESAEAASLGMSSTSAASVLVDDAGAASAGSTRILLQALAAEAWGSEADYAPILTALKLRGERVGKTPAEMALVYVSALRTGRIARRWVLALDVDCEQPEHWPASLAWERHRPTCERIVATVRAFEAGQLQEGCKATHWGGPRLPSDASRAAKAVREGRWVRAECAGKTANQFFREVR